MLLVSSAMFSGGVNAVARYKASQTSTVGDPDEEFVVALGWRCCRPASVREVVCSPGAGVVLVPETALRGSYALCVYVYMGVVVLRGPLVDVCVWLNVHVCGWECGCVFEVLSCLELMKLFPRAAVARERRESVWVPLCCGAGRSPKCNYYESLKSLML